MHHLSSLYWACTCTFCDCNFTYISSTNHYKLLVPWYGLYIHEGDAVSVSVCEIMEFPIPSLYYNLCKRTLMCLYVNATWHGVQVKHFIVQFKISVIFIMNCKQRCDKLARLMVELHLVVVMHSYHTITYSLICRIAPYLPNMSYISSVEISNGRFLK